MAGTEAFRAKTGLFNLLDNAVAFNGVEVWYGYQGEIRPREFVWIGEIEWQYENAVVTGLGPNSREEQFRIVLTFEVHRPGDTQQDANARVEQLMVAAEALLKAKNPLGLLNPVAVGMEPQLLGEGADPDGRGAILVTTVVVRARK